MYCPQGGHYISRWQAPTCSDPPCGQYRLNKKAWTPKRSGKADQSTLASSSNGCALRSIFLTIRPYLSGIAPCGGQAPPPAGRHQHVVTPLVGVRLPHLRSVQKNETHPYQMGAVHFFAPRQEVVH